MNKNLLNITPVEKYEAPKIPTLQDTRSNPALLKKLPSRWKKNVAVITCLGLLGSSVFSGCTQPPGDAPYANNGQEGYHSSYNGYSEFDLAFRIHHGGAGSATYVVHLTEQEAFGIIRAQLEAAGLSFSDTPPDYAALEEWWWPIGLDLYDSSRGAAVSYLNWENSNIPFAPWGREIAEIVAEDFAEQTNISVGVFYTSGVYPEWDIETHPFWYEWDEMSQWFQSAVGTWISRELRPPSARAIAQAKAEARPILEANLTAQVQEFIDFLQAEGII